MTRILVIDDEPALRDVLQDALEDEGYTVLPVATGAHALAALPTFQPNVILVDVLMPVMDGVTFCRHLRTMPRYAAIPVIFCSAKTDDVIPPDLGHRAILPKPFDLDGLFATIQASLAPA